MRPMWGTHLRAHREAITRTHHMEPTMHHHLSLTTQLAEIHRQDLLADADRHRRIARHPERTRRILRRR